MIFEEVLKALKDSTPEERIGAWIWWFDNQMAAMETMTRENARVLLVEAQKMAAPNGWSRIAPAWYQGAVPSKFAADGTYQGRERR